TTIEFAGCAPIAFESSGCPARMLDQLIAAGDRIYIGPGIITAQYFLGSLEVIRQGHTLGTRCPYGVALHLVDHLDHTRSRPERRSEGLLARTQLAPFRRLHCLPSPIMPSKIVLPLPLRAG